MASPWSLEKELCGLAKVRSAPKALWRLGVISEPSPDVILQEVQDWTRGGAETYIYRFRVLFRGTVQDVLLKAVVAFSTARSLTEIADEWVARRRLLESEGVATPTLYCAKRALLMERFVPYNLADFLATASASSNDLIDQVIRFAATLDKAGFFPVAPFHGLRTDGASVFAVDVGQDLGPPTFVPRYDGRMLTEAIRWLDSCGQEVDKDRAISLYARHVAGTKNGEGKWI